MKLHTTGPIKLLGGGKLIYIIPQDSLDLLRSRHFLGRGMAKAGNFAHWDTPQAAFNDIHAEFERHVIATQNEARGDKGPIVASVEITMERAIGWSCTAPVAKFDPSDLQKTSLSVRRTGQMVRSERHDLLAPTTRLVTLIFRLHLARNRRDWLCMILNLRPGEDIMVERGDLTEQTGLAVYPFGHPGEPLPSPVSARR